MSPHEAAVTGWFSFYYLSLMCSLQKNTRALLVLDEKTKTYFYI
jgi:hypothetical protein